MPGVEEKKTRILRQARKRDRKTLQVLADGIGVPWHGLTQPVAALVAEGRLVRHDGRPPTYTKAP